MPARRIAHLAVAAGLSLGALSGCASDAGSDVTAPEPAAVTTTTTPPLAPLHILVSNDDGYSADGIDALVEGLLTLEDVEVTVVAPLEQQSGTGGKSTDGELAVTDVELQSGHRAKAVDGFPSDTIRVAVDEMGIEPDVVITGINSGQNVGPLLNISGTIGAARAAVARDIPALATSQGAGDELDYDVAVPLIIEWVTEHREALAAGDAPVEVTNLNVPSCDTGELRGLIEIEAETTAKVGDALAGADCTSSEPEDSFAGDVSALNNGFATIGVIPAEPAA